MMQKEGPLLERIAYDGIPCGDLIDQIQMVICQELFRLLEVIENGVTTDLAQMSEMIRQNHLGRDQNQANTEVDSLSGRQHIDRRIRQAGKF